MLLLNLKTSLYILDKVSFWIHVLQIFPPTLSLAFYFPFVSFEGLKFKIMELNLLIFPNLIVTRILSYISSGSFRFMIFFQVNICMWYEVRVLRTFPCFVLLYMNVQMSLMKDYSFPLNGLGHLSKTNWPYLSRSGTSVLSH